MLFDSFLFFQELELLEVRLNYLYPIVDKFLIVEAPQTFKGNRKNYNFQNNIERYTKYLDKIIYFKIEDFHQDPEELMIFLKKNKSSLLRKIYGFIEKHNFYDKKNLSHILDTYHRESIHIPLKKFCKDTDLIILSDLDEIPSFEVLNKLKKQVFLKKPKVIIQHEFQFSFSNFSNSNWFGSIIMQYKNLKNESLNSIRYKSKEFDYLFNSGYHLTSFGDIKTIKRKIESWAHQEFNDPIIKKNIEKNIYFGKDIFYRFNRKDSKNIDLKNTKLIDIRMKKIILSKEKKEFLTQKKSDIFYNIKYFFVQLFFYSKRSLKNPKKFFNKIKKVLFYYGSN